MWVGLFNISYCCIDISYVLICYSLFLNTCMGLYWPVIFTIREWSFTNPTSEPKANREHWYDPTSSGYLTTVFGIFKCRYDDMTLLTDALTVTPVLFSNAASFQTTPFCVTVTTGVFDPVVFNLSSWTLRMRVRVVPSTIHLMSIFDLPISTSKGSTAIDMKPSPKKLIQDS